MKIASFSRPHPAERLCGDAVALAAGPEGTTLAVIDGLGHGEEAHRAAQLAREIIETNVALSPAALLERCHQALRPTRGAAISIARLGVKGEGRFAGIGNVALACRTRTPVHAISYAGIVGHKMRKVVECAFKIEAGDLLCLYSDGLTSRLSLEKVEALALEHAARDLVTTFGRPSDDATVALVAF